MFESTNLSTDDLSTEIGLIATSDTKTASWKR